MKLNLLLAALLSSVSVACYAADAVSGATPNHAAPVHKSRTSMQ